MIQPVEIERALAAILTHVTVGFPDSDGPDATRNRLHDFAGEVGLDLQDTATIYRVASGEATDRGRPT